MIEGIELQLAQALGRRVVDAGPHDEIEVTLALGADVPESNERGMLLIGRFRDAVGQVMRPPYKGWYHSRIGIPYQYVPVHPLGGNGQPRWSHLLQAPTGAHSVELGLMPGRHKGAIEIGRFEARVSPAPKIAPRYPLSNGIEPAISPSDWNALTAKAIFHELFAFGSRDLWVFQASLEGLETGDPRGAVVRLTCFDAEGAEVPGPYPGFELPNAGQPFTYLSTEPAQNALPGCATRYFAIDRATNAALALVTIEPWIDHGSFRPASDTAVTPADNQILNTMVRDLHAQPRLAGQSKFVSAALRHLHRKGQITDERNLLELVAGTALADHSHVRRQAIDAIFTETDPSWLPMPPSRAGAGRIAGPDDRVMMLLKVCVPFENSGGAVRNMNSARLLKQMGWDPYAVTPLGYPGATPIDDTDTVDEDALESPDTPPDDAEPENASVVPLATELAGVPHLHLNIGKRYFGRARSDRLLTYETALLASLYRRFGGRLIHAVSGYRGYENALKALALKAEFGVPVLYDFRSFHEHTWGEAGLDNLDADMTRLRAGQEDRCVREADHTVVISEAMRAMLIERGADPARISVVPNGVELDKFTAAGGADVRDLREALGIAPDARIHGYISNISAREGHAVLLQAHAILRARHPGLICLIVGDGPMREKLEAQAASLGIKDSVRFTGEVPHDEVHRYYALFDAFVIPRIRDYASDYVTPLKPYEAMAAGVPIVMSELPVTPEILGGEGERGLHAPPGDAQSLAAKIEKLLTDRELASGIAARARSWVERERRWSHVLARYDDIYRALGGTPRR